MTNTFAHRTSIAIKELITDGSFNASDIRDGICSQQLVPSYFIKGEVWEHCIDSSGIPRLVSGTFKNESMFLVLPKSTGSLDCEFQFCANVANAVEAGLPIFKIGPAGMVQERLTLTEVLDSGTVVISELLRYQAQCMSLQQSGTTRMRWPWGDHHTVLLGHLEAAAQRYWVDYDPANPDTANTSETVIEWLENERKVSNRMAGAIATMLRPDGLPSGPRK